MALNPPASGISKYFQLGSKKQDRTYQEIEKHLNPFDATIADKIDPNLTKRDDEFVFSGLIPLGLEHQNHHHTADVLDLLVQEKGNAQLHPYAAVEKHIASKTKAMEFVDESNRKLMPLIKFLEKRVEQRPQQEIDSVGVIEIPVLTEPKVVTIIKTSRVPDAIRLFRKAEIYQPEIQQKPGVLKKIAIALHLTKKPEARPLLEEDLVTPEDSLATGQDDEKM